MTEPDVARGLVENGKKLVQTRFSPAERVRTLAEMYRLILQSKNETRA
jgi:hypothetical protein